MKNYLLYFLARRSCPPPRFFLIMKFIVVILFTSLMQVSASSIAQKVTLSEKNASLDLVLAKIKRQTGLDLLYAGDLSQNAKKVNIQITNIDLKQALDVLFEMQPFDYEIKDNTIIITRKLPDAFDDFFEQLANRDISGKVLNENELPLSGASVKVKSTGQSVMTDTKGLFFLKNISENATLIISFIGYKTTEVKVSSNLSVIKMEVATSKLDEVQILPYGGSTTRRTSTGSIVKISAEDIAKSPVTNVLQALAGRTPGMTITQSNGLAGGDIFFQIRGQNSITADDYTSAPLVVIDGVPYPSTPINHPSSTGTDNDMYGPQGFGSPLYNINPGDIESIEILKDADATAIYGSRAANGVMLITTKKGKQGKTTFDFNLTKGIAANTRRVDLLSVSEYLALRKQAFVNSGQTPTVANAPDLFSWDSSLDQDWQKILLDNTANTTNLKMSLSGGAGGTSFLISGNYNHENSIFPDRRGSNRAGGNFSLNHLSNSGKFNVSLVGSVSSASQSLPRGPYGSLAFSLPPNYEPFDSNGNLTWLLNINPYAAMRTNFSRKSLSLISNLNLQYNILPGLKAKTSLGYTFTESEEQSINPKSASNPANFAAASHRVNMSRNKALNFEPQLEYEHDLLNGNLTTLAGATVMKTIGEMPFFINANTFASDAYINDVSLASNFTLGTGYNSYQYLSLFGRVNYNLKNKYILNASFRRDGSSKFGPDNRYGNFGAIGGAWIFSEEALTEKIPFLSYGKFRGSLGWVGSDNVSNYKYFPTYEKTLVTYAGEAGIKPAYLGNSEFGWESTTKLEAALELGFIKDRILLSTSWYRNRTGNQLVEYPVSSQTGFQGYTANLNNAVVQNSGWEIELNTINARNESFKWTSSINLTIPENKLLKFDGIENTGYANTMVVGNPLSSIYMIKYVGVDETGKPKYEDFNNNGTIDFFDGLAAYGRGDKTYVGKTYSKFYGGFSNTFSYKNIQLDFLFQYNYGQTKASFLGSTPQPGSLANISPKVIEAYRALGLEKTFVRSNSSAEWYYFTNSSDATYMDASFIRLNNISMSYNFPKKALQKLHLGNARIYVQAQNLFVISNYDGFDPESGATSVPPLLHLIGGLQFSF